MKVNSIRSASEFALELNKLVDNHNLDLMDAIMLYVSKNNIEIDVVASLVKQNPSIKSRLYDECEIVNLVEKKVA